MIESLQFTNFKALRDTTLKLGRFTLIVGANGTGKSTVLEALERLCDPQQLNRKNVLSLGATTGTIQIVVSWGEPHRGVKTTLRWTEKHGGSETEHNTGEGSPVLAQVLADKLKRIRVYAFEAGALAAPAPIQPGQQLARTGQGLARVIDQLKDEEPDRFAQLTAALAGWLPEFDRILLEVTTSGQKSLILRTRCGGHKLHAWQLSQGTLLALAFLTLAYLPDPPTLVGLEEPDRGLHPRLFLHLRDALYRLAHPEDYAEEREPVQVVATTHSPYLLDLYKDHPEEIVIAEKKGLDARFESLSERSDISEILAGAPLGDVWLSGVLGGVPSSP